MRLWVAHKEYDIGQMKTVITKVESYDEYLGGGGYPIKHSWDIVEAIDAIGAWKAAKEKYDERY